MFKLCCISKCFDYTHTDDIIEESRQNSKKINCCFSMLKILRWKPSSQLKYIRLLKTKCRFTLLVIFIYYYSLSIDSLRLS